MTKPHINIAISNPFGIRLVKLPVVDTSQILILSRFAPNKFIVIPALDLGAEKGIEPS